MNKDEAHVSGRNVSGTLCIRYIPTLCGCCLAVYLQSLVRLVDGCNIVLLSYVMICYQIFKLDQIDPSLSVETAELIKKGVSGKVMVIRCVCSSDPLVTNDLSSALLVLQIVRRADDRLSQIVRWLGPQAAIKTCAVPRVQNTDERLSQISSGTGAVLADIQNFYCFKQIFYIFIACDPHPVFPIVLVVCNFVIAP